MIAYGIGAIVVLGLIAAIVRAWNAPAILAARREIIEANAKKADERRTDQAAKAAARAAEREKSRQERARRKRP